MPDIQPLGKALIVLKRVFCALFLCAAMAVAVPGAAADYTAGTPGGAGKVTIDPESGDRNVIVTAPPPVVQDQQQVPVYVYPQVGRPGPHPPHVRGRGRASGLSGKAHE
jgi:hypothetical protein